MVADMGHEDLRFVLEPAKGTRMEDPVPVALKSQAKIRRIDFFPTTTGRLGRPRASECKLLIFLVFEVLSSK
jgi:hypothetical protein